MKRLRVYTGIHMKTHYLATDFLYVIENKHTYKQNQCRMEEDEHMTVEAVESLVPAPDDGPVAHPRQQINFNSVISSTAKCGPSRPTPLFLTPP